MADTVTVERHLKDHLRHHLRKLAFDQGVHEHGFLSNSCAEGIGWRQVMR
jgi:hypothetical protein